MEKSKFKFSFPRFTWNVLNCFYKKDSEFDAEIVTGVYTWKSSVMMSYQNDSRCPENCVLIADSYQIAAYNEKHPNAPLRILDERIKGYYESLFGEHYFLAPILEKAVPFFTESGVINHIMSKYSDLKMLRPSPGSKRPQVMTMNHLGINFKIYLICNAISLFVFLIEVCVLSIRKMKRY